MTTKPLRVGIVGCGNIARGLHLPRWLAHPDLAEVVALADPAPASLDAARQAAGLTSNQTHRDPLELLMRADVDVVDLCTPQHLRRDILVSAANAGKHILCEKPIAAVPADAAAAVEAAASAGVTLAMVHNYLWLPEVIAASKLIEAGEIGAVRAMVVNFLGVLDVPGSAAYRADWRHDATASGGGVLMDMLHGVYVAEALLGAPLCRACGYVNSVDPESTVEDLALCRFETDRNAALVNIGWGLGAGGIEVLGTAGRLSIRYRDGATPPWAPLEYVSVTNASGTRVELQGPDEADEAPSIPSSIRFGFEQLLLDVVDAIRRGRPPRATGADGLRILEATLGAYKSAATGRVVGLPLEVSDPVFQRGVLGLRELELPEWSPLRRGDLYLSGRTRSPV